MTVYQCPKCELRFTWQTELDDHCHQDHPQFRHDYPVGRVAHPATKPSPAAGSPERPGPSSAG